MAQCPSCDAGGERILLLLWPHGPKRYCSECGDTWVDQETDKAREVLDKLLESFGLDDPQTEE